MLIFRSNVIEYDASSMFSIITHILTNKTIKSNKKYFTVVFNVPTTNQSTFCFLLLLVHYQYSIKRTVFSLYRYCTLKYRYCFPDNFFPLSLLSFPPSFSTHHQEGPKDTMRTSELLDLKDKTTFTQHHLPLLFHCHYCCVIITI